MGYRDRDYGNRRDYRDDRDDDDRDYYDRRDRREGSIPGWVLVIIVVFIALIFFGKDDSSTTIPMSQQSQAIAQAANQAAASAAQVQTQIQRPVQPAQQPQPQQGVRVAQAAGQGPTYTQAHQSSLPAGSQQECYTVFYADVNTTYTQVANIIKVNVTDLKAFSAKQGLPNPNEQIRAGQGFYIPCDKKSLLEGQLVAQTSDTVNAQKLEPAHYSGPCVGAARPLEKSHVATLASMLNITPQELVSTHNSMGKRQVTTSSTFARGEDIFVRCDQVSRINNAP